MSTYSQSESISTLSNAGNWLTRTFTPRRAAIAGMLASLLWILLLAILDIIQYDFLRSIGADPLRTSPASDNGVGPYGLVYSASDFIFGLLVIVFALGLYQMAKSSWLAWIGLASPLVFGTGFVFGSARCDCMPGQAATLSGTIHNVSSTIFLIATIPMTLFAGLAFLKDPRWHKYAWYPIAAGVLALPLFTVANTLPEVFSWFYIWLLVIPLGFIELAALRLRQLAQ